MIVKPRRGAGSRGVHLVEYGWLRRLQTAEVFAYRFDAAAFGALPGPRTVVLLGGSNRRRTICDVRRGIEHGLRVQPQP